jgi:hypothetical protein
MDILDIARTARDFGMKGVVVKDHHFSTAPLAKLVKEVIPEVDIIGGVTLGSSVGGLNPSAVEATFKLGGKVVWMFSLESAWIIRQITSPGFGSIENYRKLGVKPELGGYGIFVKEGSVELKQEAKEIVSLCKQYDAVLETSHLSPQEGVAITREAKAQGLKKVVVTHANQEVTPYTVAQQKELVSLGAHIMYCMANYMTKPTENGESSGNLGKLIREVGYENIVLGTDFGLAIWPPAPEGVRMMVMSLIDQGFSDDEISRMIRINSEKLYAS